MKAAERHRAEDWTGVEHPFVVEHAVIGQLVLGAAGGDAAALEQIGGVVQPVAVVPGAADNQRRTAIGGVGGEVGDRRLAGGDEGRLADQILGRVAGNGKLRRHHQPGPEGGPLRTGAAQTQKIVLHRTDMRVDLGQCDPERLGHAQKLRIPSPGRNAPQQSLCHGRLIG